MVQAAAFTADDIIDAWHALFPFEEDHDVALLIAWLEEYRSGLDDDVLERATERARQIGEVQERHGIPSDTAPN